MSEPLAFSGNLLATNVGFRAHRERRRFARVRGIPATPRRSPRTPPSPGPHRYAMNDHLERWRKGVKNQKYSRALDSKVFIRLGAC